MGFSPLSPSETAKGKESLVSEVNKILGHEDSKRFKMKLDK